VGDEEEREDEDVDGKRLYDVAEAEDADVT
jgi:hypothetical protein